MGLLGTSINVNELTSSVSGIAESIQGDISDFRGVLDVNAILSPFEFPPQVQAGLDVANQLGIKVPSTDELKQLAIGEIDKYTAGLISDANSVLDTIDGVLGKVTSFAGTAEEELNKLTWLL